MRILYLHQYFSPPQSAGGSRSYEFARRLIAHGHHVRMVTSSAMLPPQYQCARRWVREIEVDGIPTVVINVPYSNSMSFGKRIVAFARFALLASFVAVRQPADVVFATSTPLTIVIPGIITKLRRRIPMVFEVRDLWPELPIAVGALRSPVAQHLARALEWLAYTSAAHVVALSPGMAQGVMRRGIPASKVTVIPNSCDVEQFDIPASRGQSIRERRLGLTEDQPLVVYTGTFGLINGVGYLVDVAAAMLSIDPEIRFLLIGSGAERRSVIARAEAQGVLNKNMWIWEPLPKTEMPDLLAAATLATSVVIPLQELWHNSANKFFDALAAGKPIAINHGGWQAELLEQSGAGLVLPSDDPGCAARRIAAFVRDPERLARAAVAARSLAYTRFNRDRMARELEDILQQVT